MTFDHDGDLFGSFGCLLWRLGGQNTTSFHFWDYFFSNWQLQRVPHEPSRISWQCHGFWTEFVVRFTSMVLWNTVGRADLRFEQRWRFGSKKDSVWWWKKWELNHSKGVNPAWMELKIPMHPLLFKKLRCCFWHCSFPKNLYKAAYFLRQEPFWWNITI